MKIPKLSTHAFKSLVRALGQRDALRSDVLPRELRERIILHVSAVNQCAVCSSVHEKTARTAGLEEDDVSRALARDLAGLDERTRAVLRYAELRTQDRLREGSDEARQVVADLERHYSAEERATVDALVDQFTFNNSFNNTWETLMPGAASRRKRFDGGR